MDLHNFFIENNNSGFKTKISYVEKNHPQLYSDIINYCDNSELIDLPFKQKIWHYINKVSIIPKCLTCGKQLKFKRSLQEGYGHYCSITCANKCDIRKVKIKDTNTIKYGGNAPMSSEEIKTKAKTTTITKFGVDNIFKNTEYIRERTKLKYNVDHISKLTSTKERIKNTNLEKYGVPTVLIKPEVRQLGFDTKSEWFFQKYDTLDVIGHTGKTIELRCDVCSNNYEIDRSLLNYRFEIGVNPCTSCNPINELRSFKEKQICDFLDSLGVEVIQNDRSILSGSELDIFIPKHNIAIEFNGLFWHSDKFKNNDYHISKTNKCNELGIRLIHIFEDEWDYKQEIVKSRLKVLLGLVENRIFARNCEIKQVDTVTKTKFLTDNHIQGTVGSSYNLGLFFNSKLVAIMTFGKKRINLGYKKSNVGEYELLRFCNVLDTIVIGGASKLLKRFILEVQPKEIISYADRRWSRGELYESLGFEYVKETTPNYFYVVNKKRESRFKYRKDVLVKLGYDKNKTEFEIMEERNIPKLYDCGNLLYKKTLI